MAMSDDDVKRARDHARGRILVTYGHTDAVERSDDRREHVMWMLDQIGDFIDAGRREKAMRWLGFVQGWMWERGRSKIDETKDANRPRERA